MDFVLFYKDLVNVLKYLKDQKANIFDLVKDPSKKNNLKEKEKQIFERLKNKYALWGTTVLQPIPL